MTRGRAWMAALSFSCAAALSVGCRARSAIRKPDPDLNRMLEVPRYDIYEESPFFSNHMTMRVPPRGTLPYDRDALDPVLRRGIANGQFVATFPLELTEALIERGRGRYDRTCAACHGAAGYGNEQVTRHMQRKPPSLHEAKVQELPPGKLFYVVSTGYGFMPSYAAKLSVQDRWAVVAYVKALQRSQYAPVAYLPSDLRRELNRRLP